MIILTDSVHEDTHEFKDYAELLNFALFDCISLVADAKPKAWKVTFVFRDTDNNTEKQIEISANNFKHPCYLTTLFNVSDSVVYLDENTFGLKSDCEIICGQYHKKGTPIKERKSNEEDYSCLDYFDMLEDRF